MKSKKIKTYNTEIQHYKGISIRLIVYTESHFAKLKAKRFLLIGENTKQNIWIPNQFLEPDGTLKSDANIDFIFRQAFYQKKLQYAGINIDPREWTN